MSTEVTEEGGQRCRLKRAGEKPQGQKAALSYRVVVVMDRLKMSGKTLSR